MYIKSERFQHDQTFDEDKCYSEYEEEMDDRKFNYYYLKKIQFAKKC